NPSPIIDSSPLHFLNPTRRVFIANLAFSGLICFLWAFPVLWYRPSAGGTFRWLTEENSLPGWQFQDVPLNKTEESIISADVVVNGEFLRADGTLVRAYAAKRYLDHAGEIGLFSHTPDR